MELLENEIILWKAVNMVRGKHSSVCCVAINTNGPSDLSGLLITSGSDLTN